MSSRQEKPLQEQKMRKLKLPDKVSVGELSKLMGISLNKLIEKLKELGMEASPDSLLDFEEATIAAHEFGFETESRMVPRPPVVTVMGHVDHGKTTILDYIRKTHVAEREAGGITQHIGASKISTPNGEIVFIDTPGHEAFTTLRARGASVTDIVVLVVAADDGVMPQTVEAINHAQAAKVPIVVAINKIDIPGTNPDKVKQQLAGYGLVPEDWGGDVLMVPVSGKTGQGIPELLDAILLQAEMLQLKADPEGPAEAVVIESSLDPKRGPVGTVIVRKGVLQVGQAFVCGKVWGKVRAMEDDKGQRLKEAFPSTPVLILGFSDVPQAGDILEVVENERTAREISEARQEEEKLKKQQIARRVSLEEFFKKASEEEVAELSLIVKADTQGSIEAITGALEKINQQSTEAKVKVIHSAIGAINESDVMLASASDAVILGFYVRPDSRAKKLAEQEGVQIKYYRVIYELLDDVKKSLEGLLQPEYVEKKLGEAEIRRVFRISKVGNVAGCYVTEGKIVKGEKARLVREGVVVYEGKIEDLKRFKDTVPEVAAGYECGIKLEKFQDIKEGDIIECYTVQEVSKKLG